MTYYNLIQNALAMLKDSYKYAYFYGAKGQKLTDGTMNALIEAEPNYFRRYTQSQIASIKNYSRGKTGYDCSGFVSKILGVNNYSTGHYSDTVNKTTPCEGTEGNLLYTTFNNTGRHIGIDIGYGYFLHMAREGCSVELGKISDYVWENSGQAKDVDYTGAKN